MHTAPRHAAAHPLVSSRQIGDRLRVPSNSHCDCHHHDDGHGGYHAFCVAGIRSGQRRICRARRRSLHGVCRGSVTAVRDSRVLDPRRHACRERGRCPRPLSERRDGPDADHAGDMGEPSRPSRPRRQSLRSARQYSGGCGVSPRAARSLRIAWFSCRLQCRTRSV